MALTATGMALWLLFCALIKHEAASHSSSQLLIDCHPQDGATQEICETLGCIWKPASYHGPPWCYFKADKSQPGFAGYNMIVASPKGQAILVRRTTPSIFGLDYSSLTLQVTAISDDHLEIKMTPYTGNRLKVVFKDTTQFAIPGLSDSSLFDIKYDTNPFGVAVIRKSTGTIVFDTRSIPGFTFAKQYIQLSTKVPSDYIYGFGEQQHTALNRNFTWKDFALFARDIALSGTLMNLYGTHPFYLGLENDGNAHGVFLDNYHGMNVALQPNPNIITYRIIGGVLDFHIFLGPSPISVVQQYVSHIGKPVMPPYWGLGYQISRYGYKDMNNVKEVWQRNHDAGIPQDVQFIDIDYMVGFKDFTYDNVKFKGLPEFADLLHNNSQKLVLIWDPAIASNVSLDSYRPLKLGIQMGIFVKDGQLTNTPFEGKVWPGLTYYPDFSNPNIQSYWDQLHQEFHAIVGFDGVWNDMNEPSNFVPGSARDQSPGCAQNPLNNPPYNPLRFGQNQIYVKTLCMDAVQSGGKHYDMHNLYGHLMAKTSCTMLPKLFPGKRPYVLTRSTRPGTGAYSAHWTGDNESTWPQLAWSIIGNLDFNLFGIPWVGADVCGFNGETTEELCVRWHQLGAFYGFFRNHNSIGMKPQDPAIWSKSGTAAIKDILLFRYQYLPYLNTLFAQANSKATPISQPMFFMWPQDRKLYTMSSQFMWGNNIMVAPILAKGAQSRSVYFPPGNWYRLPDKSPVSNSTSPQSLNISMLLNQTGIFQRGGTVVPWQTPGRNTAETRRHPMNVIAAFNSDGYANGSLYWDDGESADARDSGNYFEISFYVTQRDGKLVLNLKRSAGSPLRSLSLKLSRVQLMGIDLQKAVPTSFLVELNRKPATSDGSTATAASTRLQQLLQSRMNSKITLIEFNPEKKILDLQLNPEIELSTTNQKTIQLLR